MQPTSPPAFVFASCRRLYIDTRAQVLICGSRRHMSSSEKAHFAWVIARDILSYWNRPEPASCTCQCSDVSVSCPPAECAGHLGVIRELAVDQVKGASLTCPDCPTESCPCYPWLLIFVLLVTIFVASAASFLIGRLLGQRCSRSTTGAPHPVSSERAPERGVGPFTPATLAALEQ